MLHCTKLWCVHILRAVSIFDFFFTCHSTETQFADDTICFVVILNYLIIYKAKRCVNSITKASLYHIFNLGSFQNQPLSGALKLLTIALISVSIII